MLQDRIENGKLSNELFISNPNSVGKRIEVDDIKMEDMYKWCNENLDGYDFLLANGKYLIRNANDPQYDSKNNYITHTLTKDLYRKYYKSIPNGIIEAKAVWNEYSQTFRTPIENYCIASVEKDGHHYKIDFERVSEGRIRDYVKTLKLDIYYLNLMLGDSEASKHNVALTLNEIFKDFDLIKTKKLTAKNFENHGHETRAYDEETTKITFEPEEKENAFKKAVKKVINKQ